MGCSGVALVVGAGSGLGAVGFRYLVYFFTWAATGHVQFGQQGRVPSAHFPWLGLGFFVVAPVVGGLVYGPLIYRFAREARGHGVPEVMVAVAENGGRIRPQVAVVKATASALCIGAGGSVGRERPDRADRLGTGLQPGPAGPGAREPAAGPGGVRRRRRYRGHVQRPHHRRVLRRRGHLAGVLHRGHLHRHALGHGGRRREPAVPRRRPVPVRLPLGIALGHARNYLLVALLAVVAALLGLAFKNVLYKTEDVCDRLWQHRPEWARPAVGGVALGLLLLAVPQLYGVGYPVMYKAVAGSYALWFLVVLVFTKMVATSLTIGIGGSGGVFAPSLFIGATSGMAFGQVADHLFAPVPASPPCTPWWPWGRCSAPPPGPR